MGHPAERETERGKERERDGNIDVQLHGGMTKCNASRHAPTGIQREAERKRDGNIAVELH